MTQIILRSTEREIVLRGDADARTGWTFSDLIDWWGLSDNKLGARERPQAHGAFQSSRSLRTSKAISFNARFLADSPQAAEAAIDDLGGLGSESPILMIVTAPSGSTQRSVSIDAVTRLDQREVDYGTVAVDVLAADPRRYDVEAQAPVTSPAEPGQGRVWPAVWPLVWPGGGSAGRITLVNAGRAPSAPTFVLSGGFDTALITCLETGSRIGFNRPVPVGSQVVIDTVNRRATIDGVSDVSRWLQFREWEVVPGGASRTFQFDATGVVRGPWEVTATNLAFGVPNAILASRVNDVMFGGDKWYQFSATGTPGGMRQLVPGLIGGQAYTFSAEVANPGATAISLSLISVADTGGTMTTLQPGERKVITATGARASYDGGYNFADVRGPSGTVFLLRRSTVQVAPVNNVTPFNGDTLGSDTERYRWTAGADSSPSVRENRPHVQASLEGQVRSAWW